MMTATMLMINDETNHCTLKKPRSYLSSEKKINKKTNILCDSNIQIPIKWSISSFTSMSGAQLMYMSQVRIRKLSFTRPHHL